MLLFFSDDSLKHVAIANAHLAGKRAVVTDGVPLHLDGHSEHLGDPSGRHHPQNLRLTRNHPMARGLTRRYDRFIRQDDRLASARQLRAQGPKGPAVNGLVLFQVSA